MTRYASLLIFALTTAPAWATGTTASAPTSSTSRADSASLATSSALSEATSTASQTQTASGTASQSQSATGGSSQAVNGGNNASMSSVTRRSAPAVNAPSVYASAACSYGWSAGISTPVGGAAGGKARIDQQCDYRENIRIVAALNPALALRVACAVLDGFRDVPTSECVYVAPPVDKEYTQAEYVTREELAESQRRVLERLTGK